MNTRIITAIAKKDLLEVSQNKSAWTPMLIVPFIFVVLMPLAMILIPPSVGDISQSMSNQGDFGSFMKNMPPSIAQSIAGLEPFPMMVKLILGYFFAPMFLIFPLMFSTIIAAESFAGERERKTMEALLYTPATDTELFLGKVVAGFVPALLITWVSFFAYAVVVNVAGMNIFHALWFPLPGWYPLIFWITPALAVLGIAFTVLISSRTQTFMGAYQSSAALVILVLGLVAGQATGVLYLSVGVGMVIGLVVWAIAAVLVTVAVRSFNRSKLLTTG
jgi:ABC-2 type transport system permease protein